MPKPPRAGQRQLFPEALADPRQITMQSLLGDKENSRIRAAEKAREERAGAGLIHSLFNTDTACAGCGHPSHAHQPSTKRAFAHCSRCDCRQFKA